MSNVHFSDHKPAGEDAKSSLLGKRCLCADHVVRKWFGVIQCIVCFKHASWSHRSRGLGDLSALRTTVLIRRLRKAHICQRPQVCQTKSAGGKYMRMLCQNHAKLAGHTLPMYDRSDQRDIDTSDLVGYSRLVHA